METTPAIAVVPAGQVDAAGVVVALDQALRALVDIWGQTSRRQTGNPETTPQVWKITREDCCCLLFTAVIFTHCALKDAHLGPERLANITFFLIAETIHYIFLINI